MRGLHELVRHALPILSGDLLVFHLAHGAQMICAIANTAGQLVLDTTTAQVSSCTYVVLSGTEAANLSASPFNLTVEQGGLIAGAILSLWAAAWLCKILIRQFSQSTE